MDEKVSQAVIEFFEHYPQKSFRKDELLIRAGENPAGVFYLEKGRVKQYDIANDGRKIVVNIFQSPAFFPMSWAINGSDNIYYYEADCETVARCAPPEEVVAFIQDKPDVLFNLLSRVYRGTDGVLRRMAHALGGKASTLLTHELIVCCRRFGTLENPNHYILSITDQELATHTGLSRETVNRELQSMKKVGLLELGYGKIIVKDIAKLENALGTRL